MVKDTYLFRGLIGVLVGAATGFTFFKILGGDLPGFPLIAESLTIEPKSLILTMAIGGLGMAFFSVLAVGCPFRQLVMAAEGRRSAILYLVGFYLGIFFFYFTVIEYLTVLVRILG